MEITTAAKTKYVGYMFLSKKLLKYHLFLSTLVVRYVLFPFSSFVSSSTNGAFIFFKMIRNISCSSNAVTKVCSRVFYLKMLFF
jgi:hypothetical protein